MAGSTKPRVVFTQHGRVFVGIIRSTEVMSTLNVAEFGNDVLEFVQVHPALNLLLSFEHVDYLPGPALNELLRLQQAVQETKGRLRFCGVSDVLQETFKDAQLDRTFMIHANSAGDDLQRFERSLDLAAEDATWQELTEHGGKS